MGTMTSCQTGIRQSLWMATVWELCEDRRATSEMVAIAAETEAWSAVNNMVLNGDKTKEMVIHFGHTGADTGLELSACPPAKCRPKIPRAGKIISKPALLAISF